MKLSFKIQYVLETGLKPARLSSPFFKNLEKNWGLWEKGISAIPSLEHFLTEQSQTTPLPNKCQQKNQPLRASLNDFRYNATSYRLASSIFSREFFQVWNNAL